MTAMTKLEADFIAIALRLVKILEFRFKGNYFYLTGFRICSLRDSSRAHTPRARDRPRGDEAWEPRAGSKSTLTRHPRDVRSLSKHHAVR